MALLFLSINCPKQCWPLPTFYLFHISCFYLKKSGHFKWRVSYSILKKLWGTKCIPLGSKSTLGLQSVTVHINIPVKNWCVHRFLSMGRSNFLLESHHIVFMLCVFRVGLMVRSLHVLMMYLKYVFKIWRQDLWEKRATYFEYEFDALTRCSFSSLKGASSLVK